MTKYVYIENLRPNNWFLDKSKLDHIREIWNRGDQNMLPPVVVTLIDGELGLIDGHCRAFVALEYGADVIQADIVEAAQLVYKSEWLIIFHRQGPYIGVKKVQDLGKRIINTQNAEKVRPSLVAI
jgi:hypothetical protein